MIRLRPIPTTFRRAKAVLSLFCFGIMRVAAQPLNPSAPNAVAETNASAPELVTTATTTNFTLPTQLERFDFILATARFQANTRAYAEAEKNFVKLLAEDVPEATQQVALLNWPRRRRRKTTCRAHSPSSRNIFSAGRAICARRKFICNKASCSARWGCPTWRSPNFTA